MGNARCDTIVRGATVIDGTGAPRYTADVGVTGDRIVATGDLGGSSADREIVAAGKILAPGFIDAHAHDDRAVLCGPDCTACKLSQGVTSVVVGNCGISLSPGRFGKCPPSPLDMLGGEEWWRFDSFGDYADRLRDKPSELNTYALIGHMTLRVEAMGDEWDRPASDKEIARMRQRLGDALEQGASGFSTGLAYAPNEAAPTEEVIAVGEALRPANGLYVTHMRNYYHNLTECMEEAFAIGRGIGVPLVISHHKCGMRENFGRATETLAMIDEAAKTHTVDFDAYPYAAAGSGLDPDAFSGGLLDAPITIMASVPHPEMAGRDLDDVAREWGLSRDAAARRLMPADSVYRLMDEADVREIVSHPRGMIGSDGVIHERHPHPRTWGTFPRVLGHYARELGLMSLETAIHKMTGRTAEVFGIVERGCIRPGNFADLVLFDADTVLDTATYENPSTPADGIEEVWVNGISTYVGGSGATGESAGRVLTRNRH